MPYHIKHFICEGDWITTEVKDEVAGLSFRLIVNGVGGEWHHSYHGFAVNGDYRLCTQYWSETFPCEVPFKVVRAGAASAGDNE